MMERTAKPIFLKDQDTKLFQRLRQEVNDTVKKLEPLRKTSITCKAILFPCLYFLSYAAALTWGRNPFVLYGCYILMGFFIITNFLNLIHEAVHGTLFRSRRLNNWYVHFFDLMGANSYIWKIRHIRLHHNYPNVMGWDSDFEQSDLARVFPGAPYSGMHRYQHLYLPLLYPLFLFNWLLIRDFKDFFNRKKLVWKVTTIPTVEFIKLFLFKGLFFFYTLVLPELVLHIGIVETFTAFLLMVFTASLVALIVLLSPHASIESEFPIPDKALNLPGSWITHQLSCTNDVKEDTWFTRFFMGCFNYHVAHHLFPSVHHVYYPEVTQLIERFAATHHLPYRKVPLLTALKNHYRLLKANAIRENIFEETM